MKNYEVYSSAYLASALAQQQLRQEKMNLDYEQKRKSLEGIVGDLNRQKIELIRQLRIFSDSGSVSTRTSPTEITESAIPADLKTARAMVESLINTAVGAKTAQADETAAALQTVGEGGGVYDDVSRIASNASKANSKKQAVNTFRAARRLALDSDQHKAAVGTGVMAAIASYNKAFEDQPHMIITPDDMKYEQRQVDVEGGTSTEVRTTMRDPRALARLTEELDLVQSELETFREDLTTLTPEQAELRLGRGNPYLQPLQNLREYRQMRSQADRLRSMSDKEKAFYSAIKRHQSGETTDKDYSFILDAIVGVKGSGQNFDAVFDQLDALRVDGEDMNDLLLAYVDVMSKGQPGGVNLTPQVEAERKSEDAAAESASRFKQFLERPREVILLNVPPPSAGAGVEGEPQLTLREARQMDRNAAREKRRIDRAAENIPLPPSFAEMTDEQKADFLYEYYGYEFMGRGPSSESSTGTVFGKSETQEFLENVSKSAREEARDLEKEERDLEEEARDG